MDVSAHVVLNTVGPGPNNGHSEEIKFVTKAKQSYL